MRCLSPQMRGGKIAFPGFHTRNAKSISGPPERAFRLRVGGSQITLIQEMKDLERDLRRKDRELTRTTMRLAASKTLEAIFPWGGTNDFRYSRFVVGHKAKLIKTNGARGREVSKRHHTPTECSGSSWQCPAGIRVKMGSALRNLLGPPRR